MRVLISPVGTRGDVQPVVALALEVRQLGHSVRRCVPPNFVDWVVGLGFEATPIGVEMRAPRAGAAPAVPSPLPDLIADQFEVVGSAAEGCQLIIGGGAHQYAARSIAELRGADYPTAVYAPVSIPSPTRAPPGKAEETPDPAENLQLWSENKRAWNARALERVNANRTRRGLSPIDDVLGHILTDHP